MRVLSTDKKASTAPDDSWLCLLQSSGRDLERRPSQ